MGWRHNYGVILLKRLRSVFTGSLRSEESQNLLSEGMILIFWNSYRSKHMFTWKGSDWNSVGKSLHRVGFVCLAFRSQGFFLKFCREKQHRQNPRTVTLARQNFNRNLVEWKYALTCIRTERSESYPWTIVPWSILSNLAYCQRYFSRIWFKDVIGWNNLYFNRYNIDNISSIL